MSRKLVFWCGILCVFVGTMAIVFASGVLEHESSQVDEESAGRDVHHVVLENEVVSKDPDAPPVEFEMTDQKGRKFNSQDLEGKIWVGSIFYASCPGTCKIQNTRVAELQKEFGDQGVEFVSITCDPDNDTVTRLHDYSNLFGADAEKWHFLTGDFATAKQVGEQKFGIVVRNQTHSDRLILFDRDGSLVGRFRSLEPVQFEKLKMKIRKLLAGEPVDLTDNGGEPAKIIDQTEAN